VLTRLRSHVGSAEALAERVERDVELVRDPLSELGMAATVQALTIADMKATLAELDLSHATMLMDGPEKEVNAALRPLGRNASFIAAPPKATSAAPGNAAPTFKDAEQHVLRAEIEPALTEQPQPRRFAAIALHAALAAPDGFSAATGGYTLAGELGYRYGWWNGVGGRLAVGRFTSDAMDANGLPTTATLIPIDALGVWHLGAGGRTWGELLAGLHLEHSPDGWGAAPMLGVHGGVDLVVRGANRFGISLCYEGTAMSSLDYSALSLGLVWRQ
jgi:hypothetical protein